MYFAGMIENAVGKGLQTVGIGMLFVLGIIALLYVALLVLIPIFSKIASKKPAAEKTEAPAVVTPKAVTPAEDDAELVAVITAAISAATNSPVGTFRVVNFKRIK